MHAWNALNEAYQSKGIAPDPPRIEEGHWAPSGMEDLQPAFEWAVDRASGDDRDLWRCHYGAWLAGTGEIDKAIEALSVSDSGVGKALLARLLASKDDMNGAAKAFAAIRERWLQLHPQVVVERDKVLRRLGKTDARRARAMAEGRGRAAGRMDCRAESPTADRQGADPKRQTAAADDPLSAGASDVQPDRAVDADLQSVEGAVSSDSSTLGEDRLARFGAYREFE